MRLTTDFLPKSVARAFQSCQVAPAPVLALPGPRGDLSELWSMIKHAIVAHNSVYRLPGLNPRLRIGGCGLLTAVTLHVEHSAAGSLVVASSRAYRGGQRFYRVDITYPALLALVERALHQHRAGKFAITERSALAYAREHLDRRYPARAGWQLVKVANVMPASRYRKFTYRRIEVA